MPKGARVGCELSFETVATNNVAGELSYASMPTFEIIKKAWNVNLVDATRLLLRLRMVKSVTEIAKIRLANEIAAIGLRAAYEFMREGVKESEIAAIAERAVREEGIGYKKTIRRARGFAFVMSGPNSAKAWYPFNISSDRRIQEGDLVLIEFNVYADGYWADVTRTWILGKPSTIQEDMHLTLLEAQRKAWEHVGDEVKASEVDKIAREVIALKGYGRYFPHRLGHGIGLRIHEPPALHPASNDVLKKGMVVTVEPGIYTNKFGIRIEDDILILETGCEVLSKFDRSLRL